MPVEPFDVGDYRLIDTSVLSETELVLARKAWLQHSIDGVRDRQLGQELCECEPTTSEPTIMFKVLGPPNPPPTMTPEMALRKGDRIPVEGERDRYGTWGLYNIETIALVPPLWQIRAMPAPLLGGDLRSDAAVWERTMFLKHFLRQGFDLTDGTHVDLIEWVFPDSDGTGDPIHEWALDEPTQKLVTMMQAGDVMQVDDRERVDGREHDGERAIKRMWI